MKKFRRLILPGVILLSAIIFSLFIPKNKPKKTESSFVDQDHDGDRPENDLGIKAAVDYYNSIKNNPATGKVSMDDIKTAYDQANSMKKVHRKKDFNISWENVGPDNIGGRTRAIVVDKDNNKIIYAGAVSGGIWKSTNGGTSWERKEYSGNYTNLAVSSMVQTINGDLYFGTGELNLARGVGGDLNSAFIGMGIWKSTDRGETWTQLESTIPNPVFTKGQIWSNVNELAVDKVHPNKIFAATQRGLRISEDGGQTWDVVSSLSFSTIIDVAVTNDGNTVFVSSSSGQGYKSTDGGQSFSQLDAKTDFPIGNLGRIEFAIAPSNENYIYACVGTSGFSSSTYGIYQSKDKGASWTSIGKGNNYFNPLGNQADYDNVIAVDPYNPEKIYVGGVTFWIWNNNTWYQAASLSDYLDNENRYKNPYYIHADNHEITFDTASNPPIMYIGNDGGIFKSSDFSIKKNPTYKEINVNYTTAQFYAIDAAQNGKILGGTQDNGVLRFEINGLTGKSVEPAASINNFSGDGFYTAFSRLNNDIVFYEYQYGRIGRSLDQANNASKFDDGHLPAEGNANYPFNTPFRLWESDNDQNSKDSVLFTSDTTAKIRKDQVVTNNKLAGDSNFVLVSGNQYKALKNIAFLPGDTVTVTSPNGNVKFKHVLKHSLPTESGVLVKDIIQSIFVVASYSNVWLTKDALNFTKTPTWFKLSNSNVLSGNPYCIEISNNGDMVLVGGLGGGNKLFRITGIQDATFKYPKNGQWNPQDAGIKITQIGSFGSGQIVVGIGIDPNDSKRAVVTLGNYGQNLDHVYFTENVMDTQKVTYKTLDNVGTNKLPDMPVYDGMINISKPNEIYVSSELGMWAFDLNNQFDGWTEINDGMERVPTFMIRQVLEKEWHDGPSIYIGTHGRGVFKTSLRSQQNIGFKEYPDGEKLKSNIYIFPNPAVEMTNIQLNAAPRGNLSISIYDLRGTLIDQKILQSTGIEKQNIRLNTSDYKPGNYLVRIKGEGFDQTSKFLIAE